MEMAEIASREEEGSPMEENCVESRNRCPVCQAKAAFVCKACYKEHYCSPAHQKEHWQEHRVSCCSYRILNVTDGTDSPSVWMETTQYVVATRRLRQGEIIMEESPLLPLPWAPTSLRTDHPWVVCVTCGYGMDDPVIPEDVKRLNNYRCSTCGWPVCDEECEKNPLHANNECIIFTANQVTYPSTDGTWKYKLYDIYQNPAMLARAMSYRYKDPNFFNTFMQLPLWGPVELPSAESLPPGEESMLETPSSKVLNSYPLVSCEDEPHLWPDLRVLVRNVGFHMHLTEENVVETKTSVLQDTSNYRLAYNLYKEANAFSHSCSPNCDWIIGNGPDFKIRITAGMSIAKGDVLTVNRMLYFTEGPPPGGLMRQQFFQQRFGFPCRCRLCADPTELGTYQLAIGCSTCRPFTKIVQAPECVNDGYYLPVDPISLEDDSDWKCNRCGMVIPRFRIQPQVNMIDQVLQITRWNVARCAEGVNTCRQILAHFRGWFFHPNHWLMIKAMQSIVLPKNTFKDFILSPISELFEMRDGVDLSVHLWDESIPCMSSEKANLIRTYLFTCEVINGTLTRENIAELGYKSATPKTLESRRAALRSVRESQIKCLGLYKRIKIYYSTCIPSPGVDYCKFLPVVNNLITELKHHLHTTEKYLTKLLNEKEEEQPCSSKSCR